jgi:hypothetical protein
MNRDEQLDLIQHQTGMERTQAHYHLQGREILKLRLNSPLRSIAMQHDASSCPLFVAADEPSMV